MRINFEPVALLNKVKILAFIMKKNRKATFIERDKATCDICFVFTIKAYAIYCIYVIREVRNKNDPARRVQWNYPP
jgi:hypothetical protein